MKKIGLTIYALNVLSMVINIKLFRILFKEQLRAEIERQKNIFYMQHPKLDDKQ